MNQTNRAAEPDMFRNFLPLGILLGVGSMVFEIFALKERGPYTFLYVYLGVVALCVAVPLLWNAYKRRTVKQHLAAVLTCLFGGGMFGALPVTIYGTMIYSHVANAPQVEAFVEKDFTDCDLDHNQVVSYAELDQITNGQLQIKGSIESIERAKEGLKASKVQTESVTRTLSDLDSVENELKAQILPNDRLDRIFAAKTEMYEMGHVVTTPAPAKAYAQDYGATRQEMTSLRPTVLARYHYWYVVMNKLGIQY